MGFDRTLVNSSTTSNNTLIRDNKSIHVQSSFEKRRKSISDFDILILEGNLIFNFSKADQFILTSGRGTLLRTSLTAEQQRPFVRRVAEAENGRSLVCRAPCVARWDLRGSWQWWGTAAVRWNCSSSRRRANPRGGTVPRWNVRFWPMHDVIREQKSAQRPGTSTHRDADDRIG